MFRLKPTFQLSKDIKDRAQQIKDSKKDIKKLNKKIEKSFKKIKKIRKDLTKQEIPKAKLKENKPRLKTPDKKKIQKFKEFSASIRHNIIRLLKEIDEITLNLKKLIFDADTILYRENRYLDKFHKQIRKIEDKKIAAKVTDKLNILKEDLKTAARRLYESAKMPEVFEKPFKRNKKFEISNQISKIGQEATSLEKVLENLNISKIDEITKNAEQELEDIRQIEIALVSLIPDLKNRLSHIKSKLYLLHSSAAERVGDHLYKSEKKLQKAMDKIESNAEKLLNNISIVKKIK